MAHRNVLVLAGEADTWAAARFAAESWSDFEVRTVGTPIAPLDSSAELIILTPFVAEPLGRARSFRRMRPGGQILFVVASENLERMTSLLPFSPELAGAAILDAGVSESEFERQVQQMLVAANRHREIEGLYSRINAQLGASRFADRSSVDERHLALAERYLTAIMVNAPDALVAVALDGAVVSWNEAAVRLFDVSWDAVAGKSFVDLFVPEQRSQAIALMEHAARGESIRSQRLDIETAHSGILILELSAGPILGVNGTIQGVSLIARDVTKRKREESALLARIESDRHVLSQIARGIALSQVLEDLMRSVEAESGHSMRASVLFVSEDGQRLCHGAAPSLPAAYNEAIDGIAIGEGVGSCGTAACRRVPVYATDIATDPLWTDFRDLAISHGLRACWSSPILAADGNILGTFAIYFDAPRSPEAMEITAIASITQTAALAIERHRQERDLRHSQDELKAANQRLLERVTVSTQDLERVWRLSQELLVTALPDGMIESVSPSLTALLGWAADEIAGKKLVDFAHPEDRESTSKIFAGIFDRPLVIPYEFRFLHKDGSYRWFAWTGAFENGKVFASGRQTTVEKEQADALRQSQKMEAVGQLTGGLAHDFNNLLAGISGSLELLHTRMQQGRFNDVERYVAAAQGATKRAAALTHRLLAFSRRQTLDPKPTNVDQLVAGMHELIQRTVGPSIPVELLGAPGLWPVLVDPSQLENSLLNLCINARDAMPDGGRITIETANKCLDGRAARQQDLPTGQYLSLCVTDSGTGMPPDVVARVFEPFFTTKPLGEGTGLGLSMIYGFAKQSGGQVRIHSEVGKGSTICMYLPRYAGDVIEGEADTTTTLLPHLGQGETVLVVDDEPTVRMLVTDVLEDLGYTAIEAEDSTAGLKVLQSDVRIDLLVTDVGLPGGMNGRQMADAGRMVRPDLKILFITGYAENALLGKGHLRHGMAVLTKPFAIETIAVRIRSMIEAKKEITQ